MLCDICVASYHAFECNDQPHMLAGCVFFLNGIEILTVFSLGLTLVVHLPCFMHALRALLPQRSHTCRWGDPCSFDMYVFNSGYNQGNIHRKPVPTLLYAYWWLTSDLHHPENTNQISCGFYLLFIISELCGVPEFGYTFSYLRRWRWAASPGCYGIS